LRPPARAGDGFAAKAAGLARAARIAAAAAILMMRIGMTFSLGMSESSIKPKAGIGWKNIR
jgi:hypothetical protein